MKFGLQGDNPLECLYIWLGQKVGMIPTPNIHGIGFGIYSKIFFAATRLGIFEAVKDSPQTVDQIARKTGLDTKSLTSIMLFLIKMDYFKYKDGRFALTGLARKYCLRDAVNGMYNYNRFNEMMLGWMNHLEEYLKTGQGIDVHRTMTGEEWRWYQLGMESLALWTARKAARITPVPTHPSEMLDIGGSHGLYSVELCKKYPTLKATILDLPEAVDKARLILAKYHMEERVVFRVGNALEDDFGQDKYDLVMMSSLMHHFTADQNIAVSKKVVSALKRGGYFAVQEFLKPGFTRTGSLENTIGALSDIVFNVTTSSHTWSLDEIKSFLKEAGLVPNKFHRFGLAMPSFIQFSARKK
jgi:ubiquinone/menaquinone biosynthesis C-methylase UbiE